MHYIGFGKFNNEAITDPPCLAPKFWPKFATVLINFSKRGEGFSFN